MVLGWVALIGMFRGGVRSEVSSAGLISRAAYFMFDCAHGWSWGQPTQNLRGIQKLLRTRCIDFLGRFKYGRKTYRIPRRMRPEQEGGAPIRLRIGIV